MFSENGEIIDSPELTHEQQQALGHETVEDAKMVEQITSSPEQEKKREIMVALETIDKQIKGNVAILALYLTDEKNAEGAHQATIDKLMRHQDLLYQQQDLLLRSIAGESVGSVSEVLSDVSSSVTPEAATPKSVTAEKPATAEVIDPPKATAAETASSAPEKYKPSREIVLSDEQKAKFEKYAEADADLSPEQLKNRTEKNTEAWSAYDKLSHADRWNLIYGKVDLKGADGKSIDFTSDAFKDTEFGRLLSERRDEYASDPSTLSRYESSISSKVIDDLRAKLSGSAESSPETGEKPKDLEVVDLTPADWKYYSRIAGIRKNKFSLDDMAAIWFSKQSETVQAAIHRGEVPIPDELMGRKFNRTELFYDVEESIRDYQAEQDRAHYAELSRLLGREINESDEDVLNFNDDLDAMTGERPNNDSEELPVIDPISANRPNSAETTPQVFEFQPGVTTFEQLPADVIASIRVGENGGITIEGSSDLEAWFQKVDPLKSKLATEIIKHVAGGDRDEAIKLVRRHIDLAQEHASTKAEHETTPQVFEFQPGVTTFEQLPADFVDNIVVGDDGTITMDKYPQIEDWFKKADPLRSPLATQIIKAVAGVDRDKAFYLVTQHIAHAKRNISTPESSETQPAPVNLTDLIDSLKHEKGARLGTSDIENNPELLAMIDSLSVTKASGGKVEIAGDPTFMDYLTSALSSGANGNPDIRAIQQVISQRKGVSMSKIKGWHQAAYSSRADAERTVENADTHEDSSEQGEASETLTYDPDRMDDLERTRAEIHMKLFQATENTGTALTKLRGIDPTNKKELAAAQKEYDDAVAHRKTLNQQFNQAMTNLIAEYSGLGPDISREDYTKYLSRYEKDDMRPQIIDTVNKIREEQASNLSDAA